MKPRQFVILAIVALLTSLAAIASYAMHNRWSTAKVTGAKLFPTLAADVGKMVLVEIRGADKSVQIEKKGSAWSLKDRGGFPVETEKVRTLFVKLADAELVEAKTRKADRYGLIELEDPAGKDAKSKLIRITDAKGGVLAEAVIGKKRFDAFGQGKGGTYVRRPGNEQTWLANAEIEPSVAVRDWVKTGVLELDAAKIKALSVEMAGEEALKVARGEAKDGKEAKPEIAGLPEGKKLKDANAADQLLRAAASIEMDDVRALTPPPAGASVSTVRIDGADGLVVVLKLRKDGDAQWASITATGEGDAKKAADDITARTRGFEFKLPARKAEDLLKRRADLLETT